MCGAFCTSVGVNVRAQGVGGGRSSVCGGWGGGLGGGGEGKRDSGDLRP